MQQKYFYVYKWFNVNTNEVFYIGKGCKNRYKEITKRNKVFLDYYKNNTCDCQIINYFDNEEEAFQKENELILYYKNIGQAQANLDNGGKGGCHFIWTEDMKKYMSINNPMKSPEQRERMSKNNPMKNPETAEKVAQHNRKPIMIGDIQYESVVNAASILQVSTVTITNWCNKGYNSKGEKCYYINGGKKRLLDQQTEKCSLMIKFLIQ